MPIVGNRTKVQPGKGYEHDSMYAYAESFLQTAKAIVNEDVQDIFGEPARAFSNRGALDSMKSFFTEGSYDPEYYKKTGDPGGIDAHLEEMSALFDNDLEAVNEFTSMAAYNPVIGLTFPIHKFILMNCMFDKCVPHAVAVSPRFTISIETRILTTPEGEEIDMFYQQNKISQAMISVNDFKDFDLEIPENETTDILAGLGTTGDYDNLSTETYISAIKVKRAPDASKSAADEWLPVDMRFGAAYGEYDRQLTCSAVWTTYDSGSSKMVEKRDVVTAIMKKNRFIIMTAGGGVDGLITAVRLRAKVDPSNAMLKTCSVSWKVRTDVYEIHNATPINVPISPEEIKDINALYQVNQLTKVMSLINTVLANYKDDCIKQELDNSFKVLPANQKLSGTIDLAPREGYYSDHIQWRRDTFMDSLDNYVQRMIQVWNDPNVTITVVGRAGLIRKLTPTDYTYQSPSNIGPVELDFVKTVVTSDKRVYTFMSSDKMRDNNNLIVILNPRNSERIMYKIFDYQAYVSNEIRNAANPALPAVHAFERWKFLAYQPVQARIRLLNPTGLKTYVENADPIGTSAMNDFTADIPDALRPATT